MQKDTKNLIILAFGSLFFLLIHNLIYYFYGVNEEICFYIALSFGLVFLVYLAYIVVWRIGILLKKGK